jgi:hypothetical protein
MVVHKVEAHLTCRRSQAVPELERQASSAILCTMAALYCHHQYHGTKQQQAAADISASNCGPLGEKVANNW